MLPGAITRMIDRQPVSFLRVSHTVDADIGDLAAPAAVASAGEPDPPAADVTDEELADGVWLLAGQFRPIPPAPGARAVPTAQAPGPTIVACDSDCRPTRHLHRGARAFDALAAPDRRGRGY